ncbi:MAG: UDP-2,4-diacetamido-2,4,6-trideoxy-beta-L-altropyranose hydrolase, partial [Burkholderiales bacterium]
MAQPNLFGTLCIRADAGELQGIGHVMRCLALAQAWQDRGGMVLFITATKTPALLDRLASEGCKLQLLKAVPASVDDAAETSALAVKAGAAWIVVDGYQFNADYLRALKADSRTLFVVDDFACGGLADADLVLNQNLRAETAMDAGLVDRNQMLGSRFALLRREFRSPGTPARAGSAESPQRASRIVVTFGGSDPGNVTGRVLELLAGFRDWRLQITVLVGPANPHRSDLAS